MPAATAKKRVTFTLHAPEASEVYVAGNFNGWDPKKTPLKREGNGTWKAQLMLPPGVYQYRLVVDGQWTNDPEAECIPNEFGETNCIREVKAA